MIYTILEEKKPISSCTLELELTFNFDSNPNNNNNNGLSSVQNGNNDNNDNSNSNSNSEQYIMLSDLFKEQELRWFSDDNKGIMPKCAHNLDVKFDLRYLGKDYSMLLEEKNGSQL
ncbi:hypothetical protein G9A89_020409 [Geosiphon pyriformis]|nr:hypothetical protein G9A89_020409 [Geosiphon pyriformis]